MEQIISVGNLYMNETDVALRPAKVRHFATEVNRMGDVAKIALSAAWKEVRDNEYWRGYGFQSFDQYIFEEFSYSKSTSDALIGIYETYVTTLGVNPTTLAKIPWYGLKAMRPYVNQDNVLQTLDKLETMTQQQIKKWVKDLQGLHPVESVQDKKHTFRFSCDSEEQAEIFREALEIAEKVSGSPIPAHNMEVIAADYLLSHAIDESNPDDKLAEWVKRLEKMFNVKITWEKVNA